MAVEIDDLNLIGLPDILDADVAIMYLGVTYRAKVSQIRGSTVALGLLATKEDAAGVPITAIPGVSGSNVQAALQSLATTGSIPVGSWVPYGGATEPNGWKFANGQNLLRATYVALFNLYGITFGSGNGSTTFTMPDCRDRFIIGKGNMGGSAANRVTVGGSGVATTTLGATGGNEMMQSHFHPFTDEYVSWSIITNNTQGSGAGSNNSVQSITSAPQADNTSSAGAGSSQNMPPFISGNVIIFTGVFS